MSNRIPIFLDRYANGGSYQDQIIEQVRSLVLQGHLHLGVRLPSTRALATQLHVARRTVTLAFERLAAEGYIETRPASGTFVCRKLPSDWVRLPKQVKPAAVQRPNIRVVPTEEGLGLHDTNADALPYDFHLGKPDLSLFPIGLWRRLIGESLDGFTRSMGNYANPQGHVLLREALAHHLFATRGIACDPDQIVVVSGTQDGFHLVGRLLSVSGELVVIEDPCYVGAASAFSALGARLHAVELDDEGLCVEALPRADVRLVYVTPSHQFPLGMTMSLERRQAIIAWARETGAMLVEDDYDSDLRYHSPPLPALTALGPDCVIYIGTFSKSIGPGFRMGYVVVPKPLVAAAQAAKSVMSNGHPWLEQVAMARFVSDRAFESHLVRMRSHYAVRRDRLVREISSHFPSSRFSSMEGGMHLLWRTGPEIPDADLLLTACRRSGVGIYSLNQSPTRVFKPLRDQQRLILMGYSTLSPSRIGEGIARIRDKIEEIGREGISERRIC